MKKIIIIIILISSFNGFSQTKSIIDKEKIKKIIIDFLKWHKEGGEYVSGEIYFVPRYDSIDNKITYFDNDSLEQYYNNFRKSNYVSESYVNSLKDYFKYYGKFIGPKRNPGEIVKIDGLDRDIILNTFEPEEILEHIDIGRFNKINIIYNKALARFRIKKGLELLIVMTRIKDEWKIDYVGYDNSYKYSFGKQ